MTVIKEEGVARTLRPSNRSVTNRLFSGLEHLRRVIRIPIAVLALFTPAMAAVPLGCTGSTSLGTFQLLVRPFSRGSQLPLKSVAAIGAGSRIIWNPVHLPPQASASAEVAPVLVPVSDDDNLITLEPRRAGTRTEWQLPESPQVIALVFGPQGLSEGKIKSLVTRNRELLKQLADYAEQSSQVESLVQELADSEQSGASADAALKGFGAQYGVSLPKLDTKASSNQQAVLLLKTVLPASNTYDPLAPQTAQIQQTGGLAASVAGLFFGSSVGLAVGGTALFQNLKTSLFPSTEFRSAFAQAADHDGLTLCTKSRVPKSKTRSAYLWAYRVPELKMPNVSLVGKPHLPLGSKSALPLKVAGTSGVKELERVRQWRLTLVSGAASIPADVRLASAADSVEIDLSTAKVPAGDYQLAATWDWDTLPVTGTLHLDPYSDFSRAQFAHGSRDLLVEGNGNVTVALAGTDFEYLEKAAVEPAVRAAKPAQTNFELPLGPRRGPQPSVEVTIDTSKRGNYRLLLTQADGVAHEIPFTVLPPNPKVSNLPVHVNLDEAREGIRLEGSGMDRVEAVSSDAGLVIGAPEPHGWSGEIKLKSGLVRGQSFPLLLKVKGLESPVAVSDAIEVVGPRPKIRAVQKSLADSLGIEIGTDELPAGTSAGLVLTVDNLHDPADTAPASRPRLELGCKTGELRQSLTLSPGEPSGGASLTFAGPGALYLSGDPGIVGYAGCRLAATVMVDPEGRSDPFVLGRVIRIPHLDKFILTTEKIGDSSYAGILEGRDLDVIEKAGWDAQHGVLVESIPTPVPGDPTRQTLRLALPWPSPAPHAPLYVWLRGERTGRKTAVEY